MDIWVSVPDFLPRHEEAICSEECHVPLSQVVRKVGRPRARSRVKHLLHPHTSHVAVILQTKPVKNHTKDGLEFSFLGDTAYNTFQRPENICFFFFFFKCSSVMLSTMIPKEFWVLRAHKACSTESYRLKNHTKDGLE
ncbi:hypothetical protein CEXT_304951 [Caerostris extrusa]|uniref:Uncharacterized protein n=1 Tax=Caerostris extrusa TaxID=172846 RepID=A0AAV4R5U8_CAEEX|nr:hypothetical protein CEXT_304951 [Caerostris extrusa]